jgi:hypothetical protein
MEDRSQKVYQRICLRPGVSGDQEVLDMNHHEHSTTLAILKAQQKVSFGLQKSSML